MELLQQLKNGHKPIVFNSEAITVNQGCYKDGNKGVKSISFIYNEPELIEFIKNIRSTYSLSVFHKRVHFNEYTNELTVYQTKHVQLRRKPKSEEFTEKSLSDWHNIELTLDFNKACEIFKTFINNINTKESERLAQELARKFGTVDAYKLGSTTVDQLNTELTALKKQQKVLEDKIMALKTKILEEQKTLAINFIEQTTDINPTFKGGIIEKIKQQQVVPDKIINFSL